MTYDERKKQIEKEMQVDLLSIMTTSEQQKAKAERFYLLGRLVRAEQKIADQTVLIRSIRKY